MIETRAVLLCPPLPPLRLDRTRQRHAIEISGLTILFRGLVVVAALTLPALGLRLADHGPAPEPGAMQAAAVPIPPPARTAAALPPR